jgi:hypothetical protein
MELYQIGEKSFFKKNTSCLETFSFRASDPRKEEGGHLDGDLTFLFFLSPDGDSW